MKHYVLFSLPAMAGLSLFAAQPAMAQQQAPTASTTAAVYAPITNAEVEAAQKAWGYVRDGEGKLRIVLHHLSLPFGAK